MFLALVNCPSDEYKNISCSSMSLCFASFKDLVEVTSYSWYLRSSMYFEASFNFSEFYFLCSSLKVISEAS